MKKNGRKYRKLKKEQESKQVNCKLIINQEVDDINTAMLSMGQIVCRNPIIHDEIDVRQEYIKLLKNLIRAIGADKRKFESAQIRAYERIILQDCNVAAIHTISYYQYYILFDSAHILGYEIEENDPEVITSFWEKYEEYFQSADLKLAKRIMQSFDKAAKLRRISHDVRLSKEADYIEYVVKNIVFSKKEPVAVMVTATMSAGKSTFINALSGKYICLTQNLACTSKIHTIINKAFEDDLSYEYDHDLVMTAGREELLNDNELNASDEIIVGTRFDGLLSEKRIVINDSPGVNFSGDAEHKIITDKLIKNRKYHLLIYVMNATQLGTNDDREHLEFVKKTVGRTQVLFVINQIDRFNIDENESVEGAIQRRSDFLREIGFKKPLICPVSARAGYLAKKCTSEKLSKIERREINNLIDKFEQMNLPEYYYRVFGKLTIPDEEIEERQLLKTCGLSYIEKIIKNILGGKIYG